MLVNEHSCILTPNLVAPDLDLMTSATFSNLKVVVEVIGGFVMPPLLFLHCGLSYRLGHKRQPNSSPENRS